MRRSSSLALLTLALALCGCKSGSLAREEEKQYDLKLKLKVGLRYTYTLSKRAPKPEDNVELNMDFLVQNVVNGESDVQITFTSAEISGQKVENVSDLIGTLTLTMDEQGGVLDRAWSGGQPAIREIVKDAGGSFLTFPGRLLKIGEGWKGTISTQASEIPLDFKLLSVNGNVAEIEGKTAEDSPIKMDQPMRVKLDIDTGLPLEQSFTGELGSMGEGTYTLKQSPANPS